jgi:hypothetical protein
MNIELKKTSSIIFSTRCYDGLQSIILHIAHISNHYQMNQRFPYRYGLILHEKII